MYMYIEVCHLIVCTYPLLGSNTSSRVPPPAQTSSQLEPPRPRTSTLSNLEPSSPTSPLGSEAKEFVEPRVEFDVTCDLGGRTALHLGIVNQHSRVVDVLLSHAGTHVYMYVCTCTYVGCKHVEKLMVSCIVRYASLVVFW